MSGGGSTEREGSSRRPSPLRATLPVQAMHRTSPLRLRNRISPDTEIAPGLDLSTAISSKGGVRSGARGKEGSEGSVLMRRTASLDAIYLKGQWPKDDQPFSTLLLDKASQTPEEWASSCYGGLSLPLWTGCEEAYHSNSSSNNSSTTNSRRTSVSVVSSPWFPSSGSQAPSPSGEQIDKFIRNRLQRTNKEGSGGGLRYSPVHGDHSVLAPTPLHPRHQALQQANGGSRSIPIPPLPKPLLPPRLRSSVEGLNQEIERLVLRPPHSQGDEPDDGMCETGRDGRRAPIAEYLRFTRSVDTQTPARGSAVSATSSSHTSPSLSPPTSPPHSQDPSHTPTTISPTASAPPLAASPRINKFLAREPPDGCERVALKLLEDRTEGAQAGVWSAVRPPGVFTLRPSQGSAFCAPDRTAAGEVCGATPLHVCEQPSSTNEPCGACASCCEAAGSYTLQEQLQASSQSSWSQTSPSEAEGGAVGGASIAVSPELSTHQ